MAVKEGAPAPLSPAAEAITQYHVPVSTKGLYNKDSTMTSKV